MTFLRTSGLVGRRALRLLVVVGLVLAQLVVSTSPASAREDASYEEAVLAASHNRVRADAGVAALTRNTSLDAVAREWSQAMATRGGLTHRSDLDAQVTNRVTRSFRTTGENISYTSHGDAATVMDMFMNSPGHRANIVSSSYTHFGVGAYVDARGYLWVTVEFVSAYGAIPGDYPVSAAAPSRTVTVTTGYSAADAAAVRSSAAYLGMSVEEFQRSGVHVLRFVNQISGKANGSSPEAVSVDARGPVAYSSTYVGDDVGALEFAQRYYRLDAAQAQKAGVTFLVFLTGLERAR